MQSRCLGVSAYRTHGAAAGCRMRQDESGRLPAVWESHQPSAYLYKQSFRPKNPHVTNSFCAIKNLATPLLGCLRSELLPWRFRDRERRNEFRGSGQRPLDLF